jgi:hypothetical protein
LPVFFPISTSAPDIANRLRQVGALAGGTFHAVTITAIGPDGSITIQDPTGMLTGARMTPEQSYEAMHQQHDPANELVQLHNNLSPEVLKHSLNFQEYKLAILSEFTSMTPSERAETASNYKQQFGSELKNDLLTLLSSDEIRKLQLP